MVLVRQPAMSMEQAVGPARNDVIHGQGPDRLALSGIWQLQCTGHWAVGPGAGAEPISMQDEQPYEAIFAVGIDAGVSRMSRFASTFEDFPQHEMLSIQHHAWPAASYDRLYMSTC